jgi:hypothetical protein
MQSASEFPFPGGRALGPWWRQLQSFHPDAFWVGYVHVHRVEAAARSMQVRPLDPLHRLVLQALSFERAPASCCAAAECFHHLQERFHLPVAVLRQLLLHLQKEGLVQEHPGASWAVTEQGKQVLGGHEILGEKSARRRFAFVERVDERGRRILPPHFIPLAECPGSPWHVQEAEHFDLSLLRDTPRRSSAWKQEYGFPLDVLEIESADPGAAAPGWRSVIADRPEQLLLALIATRAEGTAALLGFAARPEQEALSDKPVLRLPLAAAQALWPSLTAEPEPGLLPEAWLSWCRQRNLPTADAEACEVGYRSGRLEVRAPERLLHRLRSVRSDVLKGESWLLLGDSFLRPAVALQVHSQSRADVDSR